MYLISYRTELNFRLKNIIYKDNICILSHTGQFEMEHASHQVNARVKVELPVETVLPGKSEILTSRVNFTNILHAAFAPVGLHRSYWGIT